ncbi:bifunctional diguanylate cyclase/phosphodiesterase [Photobacterium sanctipauli]|uniref:Bifunctional diguanylate cyclase/phosphodiesterase n=1 Tax=Photobacterium sanctipauli TaxID=1342794 RepID=A0A2T3NYC8_9GAMM|nr:bifunctional diguanylate cyclase/phosphodiesterase [Photobacterium sanctipauli]PSW21283.1 bifunctional diguanylate cyclase/phosphodiesterase [Photobacterium sanctipauli]
MRAAVFRFFALLLPLLLIAATTTFYIYNEDTKQIKRQLQSREANLHQSLLNITRLHFNPVINDLDYLADITQTIALSGLTLQAQKAWLIEQFSALSANRQYYDQIRLIDESGDEAIRVNNLNGIVTVVDDSLLQDKSQRAYFKKAFKQTAGQITTSHFNLNIENGEVEVPHKPTIRFSQRIDVNGSSWVITINYLGLGYLTELHQQFNWTSTQNWLIDNDGQWLMNSEDQATLTSLPFQAGINNKALSFKQRHPTLWADLQNNSNNQIRLGDYLYTYTRLFSPPQNQHSVNSPYLGGIELPWAIVTRVNLTDAVMNLTFSQQSLIKIIILSVLILTLVSGCIVLSWYLLHNLTRQKLLTQEVRDSALKYETVLKHAPDGLLTIQNDMTIITINRAAIQILNLPDQDLKGRNLLKLIKGQHTRQQIESLVNRLSADPHESNQKALKARIELKNISMKYIEVLAASTSYSTNHEILLNLRDVTYWIKREETLKSMSRALEQSDDAILITDSRGVIEYVNQSFEQVNRVKSKDILGTHSNTLLREALANRNEMRAVQSQLKSGKTVQRVIAHQQCDDSIKYEEKTIAPIRNNRGNISHYISTGKDITERVLFESRLHKLAHYDLLTELPNRTLLQQKIDTLTQGKHQTSLALMSLDLDQFKQINDSLGHDTGDKVLKTVAGRLLHVIRSNDFLARLGGDEFAVLISQNAEPNVIANLANRIIRQLSYPMMVDGNELFLTASIGISLFPDDTAQAENLSNFADIALARAKGKGRNRFCFYTHEMGKESIKQVQLESELRKSVGSSRYELYYQPKVNSITHDICGVEALLRWKDEDGLIQSPMTVIPVLERSGLIIEVGEHLIYRACEQLRTWQDKGIYLNFAINISARQLLNSSLVETTQKAIIETGCDPKHLEFEITETVLMSDVETALDRLVKLESLGIKIAVDDFGTGYSSLAYLSRFPIHILKVDREFVKDLPWHKDNITITRSIVELAHNLNMHVVAEGVESESQETFLASLGVEEFQGYYFSKPLPIEAFNKQYLNENTEEVLTDNI